MRIVPLALVFFFSIIHSRSVASSITKEPSAAKPAPRMPDAAVPTAPTRESLLISPESAPEEYKVKLATTKDDIVIAIHRDWAPQRPSEKKDAQPWWK